MDWLIHEAKCCSYLTKAYSAAYGAVFSPIGGRDSTKSDISVSTKSGRTFYIETKMPASQAGQFVVLSNGSNFVLSPSNKDGNNKHSKAILDIMNASPELYMDPGTGGQLLAAPRSVLFDWVKTHYSNKGAKYVVSMVKEDVFVILPIHKLDEYFSISAIYRVKKSGSSKPGQKDAFEVQRLLGDASAVLNRSEDGRLMLYSSQKLDGFRLAGDRVTYLFKQKEASLYEVRKLSNTANANVIFSLSLVKKQQDADDLSVFLSDLMI